MKISELFKNRNLAESGQSVSRDGNAARETVKQGTYGKDDDKVSISSLARQYSQVSSIISEDEQARKDKVERIKGQVENGTYSVSSEDVASSIVSFTKDI